MERGPQGVQLPLQQGEIQGSAAHGRGEQIEESGVGWSSIGSGGGGCVGLVTQSCFREKYTLTSLNTDSKRDQAPQILCVYLNTTTLQHLMCCYNFSMQPLN